MAAASWTKHCRWSHTHSRKKTKNKKSFADTLHAWRGRLIAAGFQDLVFEDALDLLLGQVAAIGLGQASPGGMGVANLVDAFRDDTTSNMVVMLLRLITSAEVQRRADFFLPFILVGIVGLFCFVLLVSLCFLRCFCVFLL